MARATDEVKFVSSRPSEFGQDHVANCNIDDLDSEGNLLMLYLLLTQFGANVSS